MREPAAADDAHAILRALQDAVDARDPERLIALFDDSAVLVGSNGDARDTTALRGYLTALATEDDELRWEWEQVVPFHDEPGTLGFAAFGEVAVGTYRAPFRTTIFAVQTYDGWRIRQFHGSIPADV